MLCSRVYRVVVRCMAVEVVVVFFDVVVVVVVVVRVMVLLGVQHRKYLWMNHCLVPHGSAWVSDLRPKKKRKQQHLSKTQWMPVHLLVPHFGYAMFFKAHSVSQLVWLELLDCNANNWKRFIFIAETIVSWTSYHNSTLQNCTNAVFNFRQE